MKFLKKLKDGGPESNVTGYFLVEIKWLFSIVLLRFSPGSREAYHSHAFDAVSWIFDTGLFEWLEGDGEDCAKGSGWLDIGWHWTPRERCHMVYNYQDLPVWALSFRGPWAKTWRELRPTGDAWEEVILESGRKVVSR